MSITETRTCSDCRYGTPTGLCLHAEGRNPYNGEPLSQVIVRAEVGHCRPQARYWEPRTAPFHLNKET